MLLVMNTVAETEPFQKKIEKLLSAEEKDELISYLSEYPLSGDLIKKTVCCRRKRNEQSIH